MRIILIKSCAEHSEEKKSDKSERDGRYKFKEGFEEALRCVGWLFVDVDR